MLVLLEEDINKYDQVIVEIPKDVVLELIREDHSLHEVIDMTYPTRIIRVFFDIDDFSLIDPLNTVLNKLCDIFDCGLDDWAISCGSREGKHSYHIFSLKFCTSIQSLRHLVLKLKTEIKCFDETILYFALTSQRDYGFCRFPNQSKDSVHKPAPPMTILEGTLQDFFITEFLDSLTLYEDPSVSFPICSVPPTCQDD